MNLTDKERRETIENRRRGSTLWQFIHLCASLKLAVVLLLSIAVACAVATVYESKFTTQVAQAYIYKAPWFIFWLGVLCLNLFCVTLTRWPWQKKHWGFVLTHYGIIILLVGAMVGQKFGFEGNVVLHRDEEPTKQLILNRSILQVNSPTGVSYKIPFNVDVAPPSEERPRNLPLPETDLRLLVDGYSEKLDEVSEIVESPFPNSGAGVALEFASGMMSQNVPMNLVRIPETSSKNDFFGRADIQFLDELPDRSGAKPPEGAIHETQMVFANYEPVITSHSGKTSGYRIALVLEGGEPQVVIESPRTHEREAFAVKQVQGKPLNLHNDPTSIVVKTYWPDMVMRDGVPVSASDKPNNPAVLVTLTNDGLSQKVKPLLELAFQKDDARLAYQMSRGGVLQAKGVVAQGETFALGWADWRATVKGLFPNAMLRTRIVELPKDAPEIPVPGGEKRGISGVRARLFDPKERDPSKAQGDRFWIPSGRGQVLRLRERNTFVGFGLEIHNLDFTVKLLKFEVPRDEGTDTPADFRSYVVFSNPKTGDRHEGVIHMNHPQSYPTGMWRVVMGQMYKFSQAQWNPEDPGETTLQVLHDPGWPLKWSGSLLLCVGIAIMFYLKPSGGQRKPPNGGS